MLEGKRRTQPYVNEGPPSPAAVERLYKRDMVAPNLNVDGGDGLVSKRQHAYELKTQAPQALGNIDVNGRLSNYDNDAPSTGRRAWLRGMGPKQAEAYPAFDSTGIPDGSVKGPKNKASGQDCHSSPFSAAAFNPSGSFKRS